jgi:hypothetical protein
MNRSEIEISAITGTYKNVPLKYVKDDMFDSMQDVEDFILIVNLHNAEVLDDMMDTKVAQMMLRKIGIKNFE